MGRRGLWIAVVGLVVLGSVALDRGIAREEVATSIVGASEWVWASGAELRLVEPTAFYLARDFELAAIPDRAELWIGVDESYVVYLNGRLIGGGAWDSSRTLHAYPIGDRLRVGGNRVVVEARSARGAGGVIAQLRGDGREILGSDGSWTVFRNYDLRILRGYATLDGGESPWVWGRAGIARWGRLTEVAERPRRDRLGREPRSRKARSVGSSLIGDNKGKAALPVSSFDFGRPVEGIVEVVLGDDRGAARALLLTDLESPPPPEGRDADGTVITAAGSPFWQDAVARRFRYLTLVGGPRHPRVTAIAVDRPGHEALFWKSPDPAGLLGIEPPELGSPMQNEIRRELEGGTRSP